MHYLWKCLLFFPCFLLRRKGAAGLVWVVLSAIFSVWQGPHVCQLICSVSAPSLPPHVQEKGQTAACAPLMRLNEFTDLMIAQCIVWLFSSYGSPKSRFENVTLFTQIWLFLPITNTNSPISGVKMTIAKKLSSHCTPYHTVCVHFSSSENALFQLNNSNPPGYLTECPYEGR